MGNQATEIPKIEVEDSYDRIHRKTWMRRTAGFLTGGTVGGALGGMAGLVAAFLPYVLGALKVSGAAAVGLPGLATVASSVALVAGVGAFVGMAIAADVGANAASASAGLEEEERRDKLKALQISTGLDGADLPVTLTKNAKEPVPRLFQWKVAAVGAALFGAFGALVSFSPLTHSAAALLGFVGAEAAKVTTTGAIIAAAHGPTTAAVIASAVMFGMMGSTIGITMSYVTNKVSNFYAKLITGKYFEKEPEKEVAKALLVESGESKGQDRG